MHASGRILTLDLSIRADKESASTVIGTESRYKILSMNPHVTLSNFGEENILIVVDALLHGAISQKAETFRYVFVRIISVLLVYVVGQRGP
jgi:hypothetical protein